MRPSGGVAAGSNIKGWALSTAEVYRPLLTSAGTVTAVGIGPAEPYGADGETNRVHAGFLKTGSVYGAYRPAGDVGRCPRSSGTA
ncbi:hypothetical protein AB0O91_09540 [Kitasatospora sp. NPDC089797]|uniref:hypothetical protein n=1 Tax=Kitasatospora sp. NPDC089797 TaxID=3155298 RepID=UPI003417D04C